jgi:hypothetical protein
MGWGSIFCFPAIPAPSLSKKFVAGKKKHGSKVRKTPPFEGKTGILTL